MNAWHRYALALALSLVALVPQSGWSGEAEQKESGLGAAKAELGKLVALTVKDGRLVLDQESWERNQEKEPDDPEEAKKWKKAKVAKQYGMPIEHVTDQWLKNFQPHAQGAQSELFNEIMTVGGGGQGGTGGGSTGSSFNSESDRPWLHGRMEYNTTSKSFGLKLTEKADAKRTLQVEVDPGMGMTIRLASGASKSYTMLTVLPGGAALVACGGDEMVALTGKNLDDLLKRDPVKVQMYFLRPLADLGITLPPTQFLPVAMAAATSGFSKPAPEAQKKADELIALLRSDESEEREAATQELIKHFPFAVKYLKEAAEKEADPDAKARLQKVGGAHPNIAQLLPWVEAQKLHENRAYLLELLHDVPTFKAAARQRLSELLGKDYGDDPAVWPVGLGK